MRHLHLVLLTALVSQLAAQTPVWALLNPPSSPTARYGASLVYDAARDRLVLVGGTTGTAGIVETWENNGTQWLLRGNIGPTGVPGSGASMEAVYDSQRQRVVAVRGDSPSNSTTTWEWDGTTWMQRFPAVSPPGRFDFALAYDSVRGRTVLFGGSSGLLGLMSDTWEWDGTNWLQRSSGGPSPRRSHAMTFDSVRGRTVLFGGYRSTSPPAQFQDTWEWNGSYWFEHFGVASPSPRIDHRMTYDPVRQRTILCGGRSVLSGGANYNDTWEWSGASWTNMSIAGPASRLPGLAFDSTRQRTVLFGGQSTTGANLAQTWAYSVLSGPAASLVPYGVGCPGPTGVPQFAALGGSLPRIGSNLVMLLTGLPTGVSDVPLVWIGFDATTWDGQPLPLALDALGFPGCEAFLAPSHAYELVNAGGTATWSLAIPFRPSMLGFRFYLQAGVTVVGFNPGGLVFSRAFEATVGN